MPRQTQQQRFLRTALVHIEAVRSDPSTKAQRTYGGLCHKFPILVRTNGLCQALAFVHEKRGTGTIDTQKEPRRAAYNWLWRHAAEVIGENEDDLLMHLRKTDTATYLRDTGRILDAWLYYKRFAVSILNVKADEDVGDAAVPEIADEPTATVETAS